MALTKVIGAGLGEIPAISGTNLTNLDAADLSGNLPAISGASLTGFTVSQMVTLICYLLMVELILLL